MESGVRTGTPLRDGNRSTFDLQKVEEVLLWVDPYWNANVNIPKSYEDVMSPYKRRQHASTGYKMDSHESIGKGATRG